MHTVKRFAVWGLVVGLMFLVARNTAYADACVSNGIGGGNWSNTTTWSSCSGSTPTTGDSVTILSGDTVTVSSNRQVDGVTINDGGTLEIQSFRLTILSAGNTMTVNGTLLFSGSTAGFLLSDASAVTLTMGANGVIKTARTNGSPFDPTDANASIRQTSPGTWDLSNIETNGTVEYMATTNQTITDRNYNNLNLSSSGTKTWTLGATRTVNGNLTIDTSTPLTLSGAQTLNVKENFSNSGTFTPGTGTVTFNGSSMQTITGATTFNNLTLNNSFGLTLNNNVTVNQTLALTNGKIDTGSNTLTLDCSASISGASSTTFVLGNLQKNFCSTTTFSYPTGTSNGYSPVDVTLTALVTNPSSLQIKAVESNAPGLTDSRSLDRYWTLTETGDLTANLTFNYLAGDVDGTESDYRVYRGTTSMCGSPCVNTTSHYVSVSGVSEFSNWSAGESGAPTSASLISFKAKLTPKHQVKLSWETGAETTLLGFDVYRQTVGSKKWAKVNANVIQAQNPGGITGAKYVYTDKTVRSGKTYRYKLEVRKINGSSEWSDARQVAVP